MAATKPLPSAEPQCAGGLYVLKFSNGTVYVGASFDLDARVKRHFRHAVDRTCCDRLQAAWDDCGPPEVTKRVLPCMTAEELAVFERVLIREWIRRVGRHNVLNSFLRPQPILDKVAAQQPEKTGKDADETDSP